MSDHQPGQVRQPPRERFAPSEDEVDLQKAAEALRAEPNTGQHGHKQMALFKRGAETVALYCFEPGAKLKEHAVDGPVLIQVLAGQLNVTTPESSHRLSRGMLLRLSANVRHEVEAIESSDMLLTVCVENQRNT
jgi:quercetin dioxygenase-like cupin family protein